MRIEINSADKIFIFINILNVSSTEKSDLIDTVKDIIIKYRNRLKLRGFYKVKVYFNERVGLFIDLCKIDDIDYSNALDLRVLVFYDEKVYFGTDDYFILEGCRKVRYFEENFYCDVSDVDVLRVVEFGHFIYGDEVLKVLEKGILV